MAPSLCLVYDAIAQGYGSIPQLVLDQARRALERGWRVTCVCQHLEPDLRGEVEHIPLHVPRHVFAFQWLCARRLIRAALAGRRFDVLHVFQAQVADLSDVMQCCFLTRAAWEHGGVAPGQGMRGQSNRAQLRVVMEAEDRYFRRVGANAHKSNCTRMLFCSDLMRAEFARLYGAPPRSQVMVLPCPPADFPCDKEREAARRELTGNPQQLVVGYLGGVDERKGFKRLVRALENAPDLFLLWGGPHSQNVGIASLRNRSRSLGMVRDVARFYAACDVFVVPSLFEPLGFVAGEAAARGVPVLATEEVGALPYLLDAGAGSAWDLARPLSPQVRAMNANRAHFNAGALRLCQTLGEEAYAARMFALYQEIAEEKARQI